MAHSLQAIYEKGVLRPLEPLTLHENELVTVTLTGHYEQSWPDNGFLRYLEVEADESITLEQVRIALAKIPGSMTDDFRAERDERN